MKDVELLICEDERLIALDLERRLDNLGYYVSAIATTGQDAIELARERRPDLVLMDIRLEGTMDGINAAEVLIHELNIPTIFLTSYMEESTLKAALQLGPIGYLMKPVNDSELNAAIASGLLLSKLQAINHDRLAGSHLVGSTVFTPGNVVTNIAAHWLRNSKIDSLDDRTFSSTTNSLEKDGILILDDQPLITQALQHALQDAGFKSYVFNQPDIALDWFRHHHHHIGVVIVDYHMPKMDGILVLKAFHLISTQFVAAIMSGEVLKDVKDQLEAVAVKFVFQKPFSINAIISWVQSNLCAISDSEGISLRTPLTANTREQISPREFGYL